MGGNISSTGSSKDKDDSDYCQLHLSAVFNEAYVSSILDQLPEYTPSKGAKVSDVSGTASKDDDGPHSVKLRKLMTILAPTLKLNNSGSAQDTWSLCKTRAEKSAFETNNNKRIRLLLRIYQAYKLVFAKYEPAESSNSKGGLSTGNATSQKDLADVALSHTESSSEVMAAMSIAMSVAMAQTLGRSNTQLSTAIADNLMEVIGAMDPRSVVHLQVSDDATCAGSGGALGKAMQNISSLARGMLNSEHAEVKSAGLGLMLAVALVTGSVKSVVEVAMLLSRHLADRPAGSNGGAVWLPQKARAMLDKYFEQQPVYHMNIPARKHALEEFKAAITANSDKTSRLLWSQPGLTALACDGAALYLYDGVAGSVTKIGTGLHGTLTGNAICTLTDLPTQLASHHRLTMTDEEVSALTTAAVEAWADQRDSLSIAPERSATVTHPGDVVFPGFTTIPSMKSHLLNITASREGNGVMDTLKGPHQEDWEDERMGIFLDMEFDLTDETSRAALAASIESGAMGNYWEFTVEDSGVQTTTEDEDSAGIIAIGLSTVIHYDVDGTQVIGWDAGTFGYHSDDGNIFVDGERTGDQWPEWEEGDVVGCGLVVTADDAVLYFTCNGDRVPSFNIRVPLGGVFRPVVTFIGTNAELTLNTGFKPFTYEGSEVHVKTQNAPGGLAALSRSTENDENRMCGSMAVSGDFVFAHLKNVLPPGELLLMQTSSLNVRGVCNIRDTIVTHELECALARRANSPATQELTCLIFADTDSVDIRCTIGSKIHIVSAMINDAVDVTDQLRTYLDSDGAALRLPTPFAAALSYTATAVSAQSVVLKIQCCALPTEDLKQLQGSLRAQLERYLCLPIAAAGNLLVCCECAAVSKTGTSAVCYSPSQVLKIAAVSYANEVDAPTPTSSVGETPPQDGSTAALLVWQKYWSQYLNHGPASTHDGAESTSASLWAELATLIPSVIVTESIFSLTVTAVDLPAHTVRFKVGEDVNFQRLLDLAVAGVLQLENKITATVLDVQDTGAVRVLKRVVLAVPPNFRVSRADWDGYSLLFNGSVLSIHAPNFNCPLVPNSVAFDLLNGSGEPLDAPDQAQDAWAPKAVADMASRFCFDPRNNFIWEWNAVDQAVQRWRNAHAAPLLKTLAHLYVPPHCSKDTIAATMHPVFQQRLQRLRHSGADASSPPADSTLLLCALEQLSAPYGPTDWELESAEVEHLHQVRMSIRCGNGDSKKITICVQGQNLTSNDFNESPASCFVIVLLDDNFKPLRKREYHVTDSNEDFIRMSDFLQDIAPGTVVLVCALELQGRLLHPATVKGLCSIGATDLSESSSNDRSLLLVGRKGMPVGAALQVLGKAKESVSLQHALPVRAMPLCVELQADTLRVLREALEMAFATCEAACATELRAVAGHHLTSLLALLQVLKVNIFRLSLLPASTQLFLLDAGQATILRNLFTKMIHSAVIMGDPVLEDALLALFFSAVGVLYPSLCELQKLLGFYINLYEEKTITRIEMFILKFVLKRMSEVRPLVQLLNSSGSDADGAASPLEFFASLEQIYLGETREVLCKLTSGSDEQGRSVGAPGGAANSLGTATVEAMISFCKLLLSKGAEPFLVTATAAGKVPIKSTATGAKLLVRTTISLLKLCNEILAQSLEVLNAISTSTACIDGAGPPGMDSRVEDILRSSPVNELLPLVLNVISNLAKRFAYDFVHPVMDSIGELVAGLNAMHATLRTLLVLLSADVLHYTDILADTGPLSQLFESAHPYRSNMDKETEISFPGALSVTIEFDACSRTENGCDYVQFRDNHGNALHEDRLTGRDGTENWPGCGGRPALIVPLSDFVLYFHSDGSVEDWGYKFTATPTYPQKAAEVSRTHWLVKLEFQLVQCTASLAAELVSGLPWQDPLETAEAHWMDHPLVRPELFRFDESQSSAEDAFLRGLIDRSKGSLSSSLVKIMRTTVREDQGSVDDINRAVYGSCAVIIKSSGLVREAMAVAAGTTKEVPPALTKAWRAAQKMRAYFDITELRVTMATSLPYPAESDAKPVASAPSVPSLARQASLGSDGEVIRIASNAIVERVQFLLRTPESMLMRSCSLEADAGSNAPDFDIGAMSPLSPPPSSPPHRLHPYALSPLSGRDDGTPVQHLQLGPPMEPETPLSVLSSPPSAIDLTPLGVDTTATSMKSAMSSVGSGHKPPLMRQLSNDTKNVSNLWHSLVDESSLFHKLKNMLAHRKQMAAKVNRRGAQSMNEKVLQFLQSDVNVSRLEEMNGIRNKRAILRSKGFDILADLLSSAAHPFSVNLVASALGGTLQALKREDAPLPANHVHFMNAVEGCSPEQGGLVWEKFSHLLHCNVVALRCCRERIASANSNSIENCKLGSAEQASWERAIIECLYSCAMDFEGGDQGLVNDSGLLAELQALMALGIPSIRAAAEGIFEGLVDRCMKATTNSNAASSEASVKVAYPTDAHAEEPTELCRNLVDMMLQRVVAAAEAVTPAPAPDDATLLSAAVPIIPGCIASHQCVPGHSYPQYALRSAISSSEMAGASAGTTYSLWLKRPRSAVLDAVEGLNSLTAQLDIEKITVGMKVMPGPNFTGTAADVGGGLDSLGTVTKVLCAESALTVLWPSEKTLKHPYKPSSYQVVLADPQIGGHVFSVGTPGLLGSAPQSSEGILLLPNGTLCTFKSGGNSAKALTCMQSPDRIPPDQWVHVAWTVSSVEGSQSTLYVNGKLSVIGGIATDAPSATAADLAELAPAGTGTVIESAHPLTAADIDKVTRVEFADARHLIVQLDAGCALPPSAYFLFQRYVGVEDYQQAIEGGDAEVWSEQGMRKAPTEFPFTWTGSRLYFSLVVPEFLETDTSHGFKMTITPEQVPECSRWKHATNMPLFVGQLPFFHGRTFDIKDTTAGALQLSVTHSFGSNALLAAFCGYPGVLSPDQIAAVLQRTETATQRAPQWDDAPLLSILAVVRKGLENLNSLKDTSICRSFSDPAFLGAIFNLLRHGTALLRCSMYHVCAAIFPLLEVVLIETFVQNTGFFATPQSSFVEWLLGSVGRASNVWGRVAGAAVTSARECGDAEYGLAMAQLKLLRALCASKNWKHAVAECVNAQIDHTAHDLIRTLKAQAAQELATGAADTTDLCVVNEATGPVDRIYGILSLLGGDFPVLYAGALAVCCDDKSNVREECLVLGYTAVPEVDAKVDKDAASLWKHASPYGDAVAVMLLSNPSKHVTVHRKRLEFSRIAADLSTVGDHSYAAFLEKSIGADRLSRLFAVLSSIDTTDSRPIPQPRTTEVTEELVFESAHPYQDNQNTYARISIPGADSLTFEFDHRSATVLRKDYVVIYKDAQHSEAWGTKFSGCNGEENWPGCGGRPALKIRASSAELHFHSGSVSEVLWGYKCTVRGKITKELLPPPLPTLPHFAQLVHIKMLAMKALHFSLESCSWLVANSLALMRNLVDSALAPAPENLIFSTEAVAPLTLVYESDHPYENNMDLYTPVSVPGAKRLSIVFDPQTRTENNCDYLSFYTDSSHSTQMPGTVNYTGGRENGTNNWPGLQGRPPLVIDGDSFELYFHSDGSVNDWGYKMIITAEFSADASASRKLAVRGESMSAHTAASYCFYLQQYLLDGPQKGPTFTDADAELYTTRARKMVCAAHVEAEELALETGTQKSDAVESKEEAPDTALIESKTDFETPASAPSAMALKLQNPAQTEDYSFPAVVVDPNFSVRFPQGFQVCFVSGVSLFPECPEEGSTACATDEHQHSVPMPVPVKTEPYLKRGARVLAIAQRDDYYKVQYNKRDVQGKKMDVSTTETAVHSVTEPKAESLSAALPFAAMMDSVTVSMTDMAVGTPTALGDTVSQSAVPVTSATAITTAAADGAVNANADAADDAQTDTAWVRFRDGANEFLCTDYSVPGSIIKTTPFPVDLSRYVDKELMEASSMSAPATTPGSLFYQYPGAELPPNTSACGKEVKPTKHPMYTVANSCDTSSPTAATGSTSNTSSSFYQTNTLSQSVLVTAELDTLETAILDYSAVAALGYAFEALRVIITHWPADVTLSLGYFGSLSQLLTFFNLSLQRSAGDVRGGSPHDTLLSVLRTHESMQAAAVGDPFRPLLSLALIEFAQSRLHKPQGQSLCLSPLGGVPSELLPTEHVVTTNLMFPAEGYTHEVQLPGCSKMKFKWNVNFARHIIGSTIKFTPRTQTASAFTSDVYEVVIAENQPEFCIYGCDFCVVQWFPKYASIAVIHTAGGFAGALSSTYPGNLDCNLTVTGVFGELDESTLRNLANKQFRHFIADEVARNKPCFPQLACWILRSYVSDNCAAFRHELYNKRTFRILRQLYDSPQAAGVQEMLMQLLVTFISAFSGQYEALPEELLSEFKDLESALVRSATARYTTETKSGDLQCITPELQSVVQLILSIEACVSKIRLPAGMDTTTVANDTDGAEAESSTSEIGVVNTNPATPLVASPADQREQREREGPNPGDRAWTVRIGELPVAAPVAADCVDSAAPLVVGVHRGAVLWLGCTTDGFVAMRNSATGVLEPVAQVCRPLRQGDLFTVQLSKGKHTVKFYLNGASLGLVVGPPGSKALLETTIDVGQLTVGDTVPGGAGQLQLVPNPPAVWKNGCAMGLPLSISCRFSPHTPTPEWLDKVIVANSLLSNIDKQEIPTFVLASVLLPLISSIETHRVTLKNEDFGPRVTECAFSSPGATMIKLCIHHSRLIAGDVLEVLDASGAVVVSVTCKGTQLDHPVKDLFTFVRKLCMENSKTVRALGARSLAEWEDLKVGDVVVRGPDWKYGDTDGGAGSTGTITKVKQKWGMSDDGAVTVRWADCQRESLYRYGFVGHHDVVRLQPVPLATLDKECCLDIIGSKLHFRLTRVLPEPEGATRSLNLLMIPMFTLRNCLAQEAVQPHLEHIRKLYVMRTSKNTGAVEGALALARHLDSVAVTKKYSMYDLVKKGWSHFVPNNEDLTRSPALKALFEEAVATEGPQKSSIVCSPSSIDINAAATGEPPSPQTPLVQVSTLFTTEPSEAPHAQATERRGGIAFPGFSFGTAGTNGNNAATAASSSSPSEPPRLNFGTNFGSSSAPAPAPRAQNSSGQYAVNPFANASTGPLTSSIFGSPPISGASFFGGSASTGLFGAVPIGGFGANNAGSSIFGSASSGSNASNAVPTGGRIFGSALANVPRTAFGGSNPPVPTQWNGNTMFGTTPLPNQLHAPVQQPTSGFGVPSIASAPGSAISEQQLATLASMRERLTELRARRGVTRETAPISPFVSGADAESGSAAGPIDQLQQLQQLMERQQLQTQQLQIQQQFLVQQQQLLQLHNAAAAMQNLPAPPLMTSADGFAMSFSTNPLATPTTQPGQQPGYGFYSPAPATLQPLSPVAANEFTPEWMVARQNGLASLAEVAQAAGGPAPVSTAAPTAGSSEGSPQWSGSVRADGTLASIAPASGTAPMPTVGAGVTQTMVTSAEALTNSLVWSGATAGLPRFYPPPQSLSGTPPFPFGIGPTTTTTSAASAGFGFSTAPATSTGSSATPAPSAGFSLGSVASPTINVGAGSTQTPAASGDPVPNSMTWSGASAGVPIHYPPSQTWAGTQQFSFGVASAPNTSVTSAGSSATTAPSGGFSFGSFGTGPPATLCAGNTEMFTFGMPAQSAAPIAGEDGFALAFTDTPGPASAGTNREQRQHRITRRGSRPQRQWNNDAIRRHRPPRQASSNSSDASNSSSAHSVSDSTVDSSESEQEESSFTFNVEGSEEEDEEDSEEDSEHDTSDDEDNDDEEEDEDEDEETEETATEEGSQHSSQRSRPRSRSGSRRSRSPIFSFGEAVTPEQTEETTVWDNPAELRLSQDAADSEDVPLPVCKKCSQAIFRHPPGTWNTGWTCDWPEHQGPNGFRTTDCVHGCATVKPCNWGMCGTCWDRCEAAYHRSRKPTDAFIAQHLQKGAGSSDRPIIAQFSLLQLLNQLLIHALPFADLCQTTPVVGSFAHLVLKYRGLVYESVKQHTVSGAIETTAAPGSSSQFDMEISRSRARKHLQSGLPDKDARYTVYAQAFRVMHGMQPVKLRRADKLYNTKFMGEHAVDGGGPYRESFVMYAQELQSGALSLLLRTPNGRHGVGYNREKWILNPGAVSSVELEMLAFLGKLMGIAIRSKDYMALNLPSIIWKLLVNDTPTKEDLEGVDFSLVKSMDMLRNITGDAALFASTFFETFTTNSSDDRTVELIPGGAQRDVTYDSRAQYCDLVLNYRLHEFDRQAAAIRSGLATIVPLALLSLCTWSQLETMVCGKADVDVALLESVTEYSSCSANDTHIQYFWQAMREFTNEERSALLRFTWGRSRLPLNAASFPQRFKLQSFNKRPHDAYYPVAHTCFFSLELPSYSSLELMKEKLRYAIFNCEAIDGDDTSSGDAVAAMGGWEE